MSELEYEWENDNGEIRVAVVFYRYTAGRPANTSYGHPDNYSPAEPSEIDIEKIEIDGRELGREELIAFLDDHYESVYEAIEEQENSHDPNYN